MGNAAAKTVLSGTNGFAPNPSKRAANAFAPAKSPVPILRMADAFTPTRNKDFRDCPGIPRNTEHWNNLYKQRVLVERTINIFKDSFGLSHLRTRDTRTIKADLFLAGCTQLIGVMLAKAIQQDHLYKSTRKLVNLVA